MKFILSFFLAILSVPIQTYAALPLCDFSIRNPNDPTQPPPNPTPQPPTPPSRYSCECSVSTDAKQKTCHPRRKKCVFPKGRKSIFEACIHKAGGVCKVVPGTDTLDGQICFYVKPNESCAVRHLVQDTIVKCTPCFYWIWDRDKEQYGKAESCDSHYILVPGRMPICADGGIEEAEDGIEITQCFGSTADDCTGACGVKKVLASTDCKTKVAVTSGNCEFRCTPPPQATKPSPKRRPAKKE